MSNDCHNNVGVKYIKFEVQTRTSELSHTSNYQNTHLCALTSQGARLSFLLKQMVLSACCKVTKFKLLQTKNRLQSSAALTEMALPSSAVVWRSWCTGHSGGRMSPSVREADLSHCLGLVQGLESKGLKPPSTSQELNLAS